MTIDVGPDLRARKRAATHRAIAEAALELAARDGLEVVKIDDVADLAGVSRRTFFNHFTSKEDAVAGVARLHVASVLDDVERDIGAHQPGEVLGRAVRTLLAPSTFATLSRLVALTRDEPRLLPHMLVVQEEASGRIRGSSAPTRAPTPRRPSRCSPSRAR